MFDIAPSELLLCAIVALVVIGPKDLPRALRTLGQWAGRARAVSRHFRAGVDTMMREAEMEELQKKWAEENARIMAEHPWVENPEESATSNPVSNHASSSEAKALSEKGAANQSELPFVLDDGEDADRASVDRPDTNRLGDGAEIFTPEPDFLPEPKSKSSLLSDKQHSLLSGQAGEGQVDSARVVSDQAESTQASGEHANHRLAQTSDSTLYTPESNEDALKAAASAKAEAGIEASGRAGTQLKKDALEQSPIGTSKLDGLDRK